MAAPMSKAQFEKCLADPDQWFQCRYCSRLIQEKWNYILHRHIHEATAYVERKRAEEKEEAEAMTVALPPSETNSETEEEATYEEVDTEESDLENEQNADEIEVSVVLSAKGATSEASETEEEMTDEEEETERSDIGNDETALETKVTPVPMTRETISDTEEEITDEEEEIMETEERDIEYEQITHEIKVKTEMWITADEKQTVRYRPGPQSKKHLLVVTDDDASSSTTGYEVPKKPKWLDEASAENIPEVEESVVDSIDFQQSEGDETLVTKSIIGDPSESETSSSADHEVDDETELQSDTPVTAEDFNESGYNVGEAVEENIADSYATEADGFFGTNVPNEGSSALKRPPSVCRLCGSTFDKRDLLFSHLEKVHWKCKKRNLGFGSGRQLPLHENLSTCADFPWACSVCRMSFSEKILWRRHVHFAHSSVKRGRRLPRAARRNPGWYI